MGDISNKSEFEATIDHLSNLYEEAKNLIRDLEYPLPSNTVDNKAAMRLFEIIREFRDISCNQLKRTHKIEVN